MTPEFYGETEKEEKSAGEVIDKKPFWLLVKNTNNGANGASDQIAAKIDMYFVENART